MYLKSSDIDFFIKVDGDDVNVFLGDEENNYLLDAEELKIMSSNWVIIKNEKLDERFLVYSSKIEKHMLKDTFIFLASFQGALWDKTYKFLRDELDFHSCNGRYDLTQFVAEIVEAESVSL